MSNADRESQSYKMRAAAREIFRYALAEASIAKAFQRHVHCERGVLRVCEDLYHLDSYSRVVVISIGKAGHTMVEALAQQVGERSLEGIVACPVEPLSQVHGFRYFRGGHPTPNAESIRAASAILKTLRNQTAASLVIFLISGGGSSKNAACCRSFHSQHASCSSAVCWTKRPSPTIRLLSGPDGGRCFRMNP